MQNSPNEEHLVPVEKYAKTKGLSSDEVIQMIQEGELAGFVKEEKWYVGIRKEYTLLHQKQCAREKGFLDGELIMRANVKLILKTVIVTIGIGIFLSFHLKPPDEPFALIVLVYIVFGAFAIYFLLHLNTKIAYIKVNDDGFALRSIWWYKSYKWSEIDTIDPGFECLVFRVNNNYWNRVGKRCSKPKKKDTFGIPTLLMGKNAFTMTMIFEKWKNMDPNRHTYY